MPCSAKPYSRVCRQRAKVHFATIFIFVPTAFLHGQGGITTEGPLTVFRTGTTQPLLTLSLPLASPPIDAQPVLKFDFGFATAEPDAAGTFYDSFSVTLERNDRSATALLLTADRTGIQWAPPTPGALALDHSELQRAPTNFPSLPPQLPIQFAFSVSFVLPAVLAGGPINVFLDLFDNLNSAGSLAYIQGVRVEAATVAPKLHSSAQFSGPFSEDPAALSDRANRTFTVSRSSGSRFFRVFADRSTRIVSQRIVGSQVLIEYDFESPAP